MAVPISLFAFGLITAAILGFVAGWILASGRQQVAEPISAVRPTAPPATDETNPLAAAWNDSEPARIVMHLRMDSVDTWRRTHGQKAVEHFLGEIVSIVTSFLPPGGRVVRSGEEAIMVATGDKVFAAQIAETLRSHRFTHVDGQEALVSAGVGVVEETEEPLETHLERAFAAVSESGRLVRGGFVIWESGGLRHVRPVELLT